MTNLNLLRDLDDAGATPEKKRKRTPRAPESGSPGILLVVLLLLLLGGGTAVYLVKPEWLGLPPAAHSAAETARIAAKEEVQQALWQAASRKIEAGQTQAAEWFELLRITLPDPQVTNYALTLVSFTPPGEFILRGTAASMETASLIQEALVLFPGMDLRQSRARPADAPRRGYDILFTGALEPAPADTAAPRQRVRPAQELEAELQRLLATAAEAGLALAAPDSATVVPSGTLRLHTWRVAGVADSAAIPALARFLETGREHATAFGIRRVTLEVREGLQTVFLDIMAYSAQE